MSFQQRCRTFVLLGIFLALPTYGYPVTKVEGFDPRSVAFNVSDLVTRAKKGDGSAYYRLGIMFLCGHQVQQNRFIAYDYLRKSHELGYGYASLLLGMGQEFGGRFVEEGVVPCETLPFRSLMMEYQPLLLYGLDDGKQSARGYYGQALTNGIRYAQNCLDRMARMELEREREVKERQETRRRVLSGDCRTVTERKTYEEYTVQQNKFRREEEERQAKLKREWETREKEKRRKLEAQIADLKKTQQIRLADADSGNDPAEYYWAACFLRAWAATASNERPEHRVELARRSLSFLERAVTGGLAQAEYDLGRMLVGGDTGTIGPMPANRGGFLEGDHSKPGSHEWVPESIEVVKQGDVKGPCFAPYVLVQKISGDGTFTNQVPVLVYRQDVKRGMELLHRAAEQKHQGAMNWFEERRRAGLPEDAPPWVLAKDTFCKTTANPVLKFRCYERATDCLGWVYRELCVDRVTGETVARSAEISERTGGSSWNVEPGK